MSVAIILMLAFQSQFSNWIETNISNYAGEYIYVEFNASEILATERITVSVQGQSLRFAIESNAKAVSYSTQSLNKNAFRIRLNGRSQSGKFMRKLPPENAKGRIEAGILIGKRFYTKVGELSD